ncbi:uncharacterized protein LOC123511325 isoform X3 [Portunus trituberculatus]|uniref:uncharacterized protein LOC123511325 isoform X3 n=1 Tax=Portunus trituberculatus TaxID=210409 RepID=UPI001E1CFC0B|nr:uncharacterized protein LOC123511325 isoform X3 [Portunus trituberculatus]
MCYVPTITSRSSEQMSQVVMIICMMAMVPPVLSTIPSRKFTKWDNTKVEIGTVLVSKKVKTNIECGAICSIKNCLDYTLTTSSLCTTYSSITHTIADAKTRLYTAYRLLGEACRDDSLCAGISHAACVEGTCSCAAPAFPDDKGTCTICTCQCIYGLTPDFTNNTCLYTAAAKWEACAVDTQCTLTKYTVCSNDTESVCVCAPGAFEAEDYCWA